MKIKNTVEGPLGFPVLEQTARDLEALLKMLPSDCGYRKATVMPDSVELESGERSVIGLISTDSVDRDGDVVMPKGVDLTHFQCNPVVTFSHKYDELPVGYSPWQKKIGYGIRAKAKFAERPEDWQGTWLADACLALYQQGILKGFSVGFLPTKIREFTDEETELRPEWKNARCCIEECILLEFAVAPIPVNQNALAEVVSKGIADEATLKRMGLPVPVVPKKVEKPQPIVIPAPKKKAQPKPQPKPKKKAKTWADELARLTIDSKAVADEVIRRLTGQI